MKVSGLAFFVLFFTVGSVGSFAEMVTHQGRLDMELSLVDAKGKSKSLESASAAFVLNWANQKCYIQMSGKKLDCTLDRSQDLKDIESNILVKEMPTIHFDSAVVNSIIEKLGLANKQTKDFISSLIANAGAGSTGVDLPFYTCNACRKTDGKVPVWNVFESFVERKIEMKDSRLQDKTLVLSLKLLKMNPVKSAVNIIGRDNATTYINP